MQFRKYYRNTSWTFLCDVCIDTAVCLPFYGIWMIPSRTSTNPYNLDVPKNYFIENTYNVV